LDEISEAKNKVFAMYETLCTDGAVDGVTKHLNVKHKHCQEKRRRLDVEDILALYADLDKRKVQLPVFVAVNLSRIPPFAPDATDFCTLAYNVNQLQCQLARLEEHVSNMARAKGSDGGNSGAVVTSQVNEQNVGGTSARALVSDTRVRSDTPSWATLVGLDADGWTDVSKHKSKKTSMPKPPVRVKGIKKENSEMSKVTAVPRNPILAAFVGR